MNPVQKIKKKAGADVKVGEWYKCTYTVTFNNCKVGGGRINVDTDRKAWEADDPATFMMFKVRRAIMGQVKKMCIHL